MRYILAYVHDFLFLSDLYHTVEKFEEIKLMAGKLENGKSGIIWTFFKLTDSILFEQHDKSSPLNPTHYILLYPQNSDRI